jgi:hypothetical protein
VNSKLGRYSMEGLDAAAMSRVADKRGKSAVDRRQLRVAPKGPPRPPFPLMQSLDKCAPRRFLNLCHHLYTNWMAKLMDRVGRARRSALQQAASLPAAAPRRSNLGQPQYQSNIGACHMISSHHGKTQTSHVDPCVLSKRPSKRPSSRNVRMPLAIPRHAYKKRSPHSFHIYSINHTQSQTHTYIYDHHRPSSLILISSTQRRSSSNSGHHLHDYRLRLHLAAPGSLTAPNAPVAAA